MGAYHNYRGADIDKHWKYGYVCGYKGMLIDTCRTLKQAYVMIDKYLKEIEEVSADDNSKELQEHNI